ncbi:MAG: BMP family ABC transporter substrate-binding protein [Clostridiales bacterium]|nr:BMP family ABC transporter substrate-binding protein [Clostridiales bacterium]
MKKILSLLLVLTMSLGLASFALAEEKGVEIALITDLGTINDKSFNQGSWEGVVKYAEEHDIAHQYFQPAGQGDDIYVEAIDTAVAAGAKVIVTPGFLFEPAVFVAQNKYEDVHFILIDGNPTNPDGEIVINKNAVGILYAEEETGYLAGYAAVKDGYTNLGFMGGMAVPAVIRFGHGYIQGIDDAAKELGIEEINVKYFYTGSFDATPEAQNRAASWYQSGVEVIFACGGSVGNSVMAAAEANDGKVIGVDNDQSSESETVITTSAKSLGESVYQTLEKYYAGEFPGGQTLIFDAAINGVNLPMETSRFKTFSQADYDEIFAKIAAIEIEIDERFDIGVTEIEVEVVKVNEEI